MRFAKQWAQGLLLCLIAASAACNAEPIPEKDYRVIATPQPTAAADKIEVLEFFYYGCPHCYDLQPAIESWLKRKPDDVVYRRVPTVFRESWLPLAKTFYALEAMGALDKLHMDVFAAIHNQKQELNDQALMVKWAGEHGLDGKKFADMYNSFTVQNKAQQSVQMTKNYGITGTPAVVVNGKYLTSPSMTGNYESFLKVLDQLVEKARREQTRKG